MVKQQQPRILFDLHSEIRLNFTDIDETFLTSTSPLFRGANHILRHLQRTGPIGLTKTGAMKRYFVHEAAKEFDWPGREHEFLFSVNKVLNEQDFMPLECLHVMLKGLGLMRKKADELRITSKGKLALENPIDLFKTVNDGLFNKFNHRPDIEFPFGKWDVWFNVLNVELHTRGAMTEEDLFALFNGECNYRTNLNEFMSFSVHILQRLEWIGFIEPEHSDTKVDHRSLKAIRLRKSNLWRTCLKLETDQMIGLRVV